MADGYDFVIVGSGAGGCAAAYALVRAGARVAVIEKGPALPRDGSTLDVERVIHQGAFKSREVWLDRRHERVLPEEYFNLGGKTKWYGAALLRFDPREFTPDPAHACLGWPIGYHDLAPYYDEAERLLAVRSFSPEPALANLLRRLVREGLPWRSVALPLGLDGSIIEHPYEAAHFDGFASALGLKADAESAMLGPVSSRPNLKVITGTEAHGLVSGASGHRVVAVTCSDGRRYEGDRVLLAAGALHSPRLLQRYLEDGGLAERLPGYRMVGRNLKLHRLTAVIAFSWGRNADLVRKTALVLNDRFPHSSVQPLGFDGSLIAELLPRMVPRPVARALGDRAYGFFLQTEDGSSEDNRVVAAVSGGYPRLDYDPARLPAAHREHRGLVRTFRRALLEAGVPSGARPVPLTGTAHACGTLVTGSDPERSVVDPSGRVHGLENLYVVDGSVLPRSSRVNPSLTIYAWALRVADRLVRSGEPARAVQG